jgi:hypothetical protein
MLDLGRAVVRRAERHAVGAPGLRIIVCDDPAARRRLRALAVN